MSYEGEQPEDPTLRQAVEEAMPETTSTQAMVRLRDTFGVPILDASEGHYEDALRRGYTKLQARKMAAEYHRLMVWALQQRNENRSKG